MSAADSCRPMLLGEICWFLSGPRAHRGGGVERLGTDPARLGDVHRDPVRPRVLHLDVGEAASAAHPQRVVYVVAALGADGGQLLGDALEAFDLEAEVVDAGPVLAALDPRHHVVLELENGQVEVAVGEEEPAEVRIVEPADLLHPEYVHVEPGGGFGIRGGQRDVLDLRHGGLSSGSVSAAWSGRTRGAARRSPRRALRLAPLPDDSAARPPAAGTACAPRPPWDRARHRPRAPRAPAPRRRSTWRKAPPWHRGWRRRAGSFPSPARPRAARGSPRARWGPSSRRVDCGRDRSRGLRAPRARPPAPRPRPGRPELHPAPGPWSGCGLARP